MDLAKKYENPQSYQRKKLCKIVNEFYGSSKEIWKPTILSQKESCVKSLMNSMDLAKKYENPQSYQRKKLCEIVNEYYGSSKEIWKPTILSKKEVVWNR